MGSRCEGGRGKGKEGDRGGIPRYVIRIEKIHDSVEYIGIEKEEEERKEGER